MFLMCLCSLNARFTPLCTNITLIPHFYEFLQVIASKEEGKKSRKAEPDKRPRVIEAKIKTQDEERPLVRLGKGSPL